MNDENKKNVENEGTEQKENAQQQTQPVQQVVVVEKKGGVGTWLKSHWKGVVAAVTGAAAIGGSAVVAYKKGKAAGINSIPQNGEDYSLNPNE